MESFVFYGSFLAFLFFPLLVAFKSISILAIWFGLAAVMPILFVNGWREETSSPPLSQPYKRDGLKFKTILEFIFNRINKDDNDEEEEET